MAGIDRLPQQDDLITHGDRVVHHLGVVMGAAAGEKAAAVPERLVTTIAFLLRLDQISGAPDRTLQDSADAFRQAATERANDMARTQELHDGALPLSFTRDLALAVRGAGGDLLSALRTDDDPKVHRTAVQLGGVLLAAAELLP